MNNSDLGLSEFGGKESGDDPFPKKTTYESPANKLMHAYIPGDIFRDYGV